MNTKFVRMIIFTASRLLGTTSVFIMAAWVMKYGMNTNHDTSLLIRWAMVSAGMFIISVILDSVSDSFRVYSDRVKTKAKTKQRIKMQNKAFAECDNYTQICLNRMYMNINI